MRGDTGRAGGHGSPVENPTGHSKAYRLVDGKSPL